MTPRVGTGWPQKSQNIFGWIKCLLWVTITTKLKEIHLIWVQIREIWQKVHVSYNPDQILLDRPLACLASAVWYTLWPRPDTPHSQALVVPSRPSPALGVAVPIPYAELTSRINEQWSPLTVPQLVFIHPIRNSAQVHTCIKSNVNYWHVQYMYMYLQYMYTLPLLSYML